MNEVPSNFQLTLLDKNNYNTIPYNARALCHLTRRVNEMSFIKRVVCEMFKYCIRSGSIDVEIYIL